MATTQIQGTWKDRVNSASYLSTTGSPYHAMRFGVAAALLPESVIPDATIVDFGCGEGLYFETLLAKRPKQAIGIDMDAALLDRARERLANNPAVHFLHGGVEQLADIENDSVALATALNVTSYFTPQEDQEFYPHVSRILRPGGYLLVSHSNLLFDLFTFNKYTIATLSTVFMPGQPTDKLAALLTNPTKPSKVGLPTRENPLAFRFKAERFGLTEVRQEFAHFHERPPLLEDDEVCDGINPRSSISTLDWPAQERWRLLFQCSMYFSLLQKQ